MSNLNVDKLLSIIAFVFILLTLIVIAIIPPATGYEISIYDAYPAYFWFFLISAITCGIATLLDQIFSEKKWKGGLIGLAIIMFANTIFLLLPEFRGYVIYGRGDTLTHLGYIKDILTTWHIGGGNFYPIVHILGAIAVQVAGIPLEKIPPLLIVIFSNIYIVNMYLVARTASNRSSQVLLIVAFSSPLIYSFFYVNIQPSIQSLFMVPLLLYLFQKREKVASEDQRRNSVLLLLLAFFITFFHPVTAVFLIVLFLTFGLAQTLYSRFLSRKISGICNESIGKNFLEVSLIIFITFFTWYFSYASIQRTFKLVWDWLIYQIGTTGFQITMELLAKADLTPIQTFELFIRRYGAIFLMLLTSLIACVYLLRKSLSTNHNVKPIKFAYAAQFLISIFIATLMLLGFFGEYDPVRVSRLPLLMGTILSGLVIGDFNKNSTAKNISPQRLGFMILTGSVIISIVVISIGSVYGSPSTYQTNCQVSQMEIACNEWFGRSKNPNIVVLIGTAEEGRISRFEDYIFGKESSSVPRAKVDPYGLPSHFGYDEYKQIAEALDFQDRYLVISKLDKMTPMFFPENVRPKIQQYTEEDFAKLNSDRNVGKLYCNGEFDVWRVYGGRK